MPVLGLKKHPLQKHNDLHFIFCERHPFFTGETHKKRKRQEKWYALCYLPCMLECPKNLRWLVQNEWFTGYT